MMYFAYFLTILAVFSVGFVAGFAIGIEVKDAPEDFVNVELYERDL